MFLGTDSHIFQQKYHMNDRENYCTLLLIIIFILNKTIVIQRTLIDINSEEAEIELTLVDPFPR